MDMQEIEQKLTKAIEISDRASVWNDPGLDEEDPNPMKALSMVDDIIVDIILSINPDWKHPN